MIIMHMQIDVDGALRKLDRQRWNSARRAGLYASMGVLEQAMQHSAVEYIYSRPEGRYKRTGDYYRSLVKHGKYHIRKIVSAFGVIVGTRIPYAPHLEYGTMYMVARNILQNASDIGRAPAVAAFSAAYKSILGQGGALGASVQVYEVEEEEE